MKQIMAGAVVPGVMAFFILVLALPTISVRVSRTHPAVTQNYLRQFVLESNVVLEDEEPTTLREARQVLAKLAKPENFWQGGSAKEEDSPGNYVIRQTTNGFRLEWFGRNGEANTY